MTTLVLVAAALGAALGATLLLSCEDWSFDRQAAFWASVISSTALVSVAATASRPSGRLAAGLAIGFAWFFGLGVLLYLLYAVRCVGAS